MFFVNFIMLRAVVADVVITLESHELSQCIEHAKKIVEYYGDARGSNTYKHNRVESNIIGVKGEVAVAKWLRSFLPCEEVIANFGDFKTQGKSDITYLDKNIEVKSLRPSHWNRFKRMIPPGQLQEYVKKEAIVVWVTATPDEDCNVQLKGWNYAKDVLEKGITTTTICKNVWLMDDTNMRTIDALEKGALEGALRHAGALWAAPLNPLGALRAPLEPHQ